MACWTLPRVTFHGKYYRVENLSARPKPLQRPHPPIFMAVLSPETWAIAGGDGHNVLTSCVFGQTEAALNRGIREYRQARAAAGHDRDEVGHA